MEERNKKVYDLDCKVNIINNQIKKAHVTISELINKKIELNAQLDLTEKDDNRKDLEKEILSLDKMHELQKSIIKNGESIINSAQLEKEQMLPSKLDKLNYISWLKIQEFKPNIESYSEKTKNKLSELKSNAESLINKDNVKNKIEDLKSKKEVVSLVEKTNIVKEEISGLNLYKMIGQVKKNIKEASEDIKILMENAQVEEKVKKKVDEYVSKENQSKFNAVINKLKNSLQEASDVISDTNQEEEEAKKRETLRKFKNVKENYVKNWIKQNNVAVFEGRSDLQYIHSNYLKFMDDEYGQDSDSKLIIKDYNEFAKALSKFLPLSVVLNTEKNEINLIIKGS